MLALGRLPNVSCVARHSEATRRFVCRYRGNDRGDHRDECYRVYTSEDCVHGGLSPESQSVLLCLLEKKVNFKEVKVRRSSAVRGTYAGQVCLLDTAKLAVSEDLMVPRPSASRLGGALQEQDDAHATLTCCLDNGGPD